MTQGELVARVEEDARTLAASLQAAQDGGVGPAVILPALVSVFREAGMFQGTLADLNLPGLP